MVRKLVALSLLLPATAFGQSFVSASSSDTPSSIDITVTAPASIQDNDTLIAWYGNNSSDMTGVTLTGFTQIEFNDDETVAANNVWLACKVASSESGDYSFDATGGTSNSTSAAILVFRGYDGCNLDVTYSRASHYVKQTNDTTPAPQPITTATDNARVVIVGHGVSTQGTPPSAISPSTSYTEHVEILDNNRVLYAQSRAITSAGTETPGDVTLTGTHANTDSSWITIALKVAASAPTFTTGPSVAAATNGYTISGTISGSGTLTVYAVAVAPGDGTPTCTQIKAGQNDGGSSAILSANEVWTTDVGDSFALTAANKPPKLDVHVCGSDGTTDTAVSSFADEVRSADSGQTIATISAALSSTSIFACSDCVNGGPATAYFDPDFATSDVVEHDTATNEVAGCTVAFETDGDFTVTPATAGDCDGRVSFDISYEDVSSATDALFTAPTLGNFATDDRVYVNDPDIFCNEELQILVFEDEDAPDSIDLDNFCSHSLDALSYSVTSGTLPTDVTLTGSTGVLDFSSFTTENETAAAVTFTATNLASQTEVIDFEIYIHQSTTMPNCVGGTVAACFALLEAAYPWDDAIGINATADCSGAVLADNIISQTPAASSETAAFPSFSAVVSTGPCGKVRPRINILPDPRIKILSIHEVPSFIELLAANDAVYTLAS